MFIIGLNQLSARVSLVSAGRGQRVVSGPPQTPERGPLRVLWDSPWSLPARRERVHAQAAGLAGGRVPACGERPVSLMSSQGFDLADSRRDTAKIRGLYEKTLGE